MTWREENFHRLTTAGKQVTRGLSNGLFGLHPNGHGVTVIHLPTGKSIGRGATREAVEFVDAILPLTPLWQDLDRPRYVSDLFCEVRKQADKFGIVDL
jgi:hypothetical protein